MVPPESALIRNNETMKHLLAAILVLAFSGPGIAKADDDDCHVSMDRWKPREAVETMAASQGWTVARIKIDDGCTKSGEPTGMAWLSRPRSIRKPSKSSSSGTGIAMTTVTDRGVSGRQPRRTTP